MGTTTATTETVVTLEVADTPLDAAFVVSFPNGPPSADCLRDGTDESLTFTAFKSTVSKTEKSRVVVAENPIIRYTAQNYGQQNDSASVRSSAQFCVAVYDRRTKRCRLHPIDQPYALRQTVKRPRDGAAFTRVDPTSEDSSTSGLLRLKSNLLTQEFGSRLRKQQMKQREEYSVEAASVVATQGFITKTISDNSALLAESESVLAEAQATIRHVPPHDLETLSIPDIYPIDYIFTPMERSVMTIDTLSTSIDEPSVPTYVKNYSRTMKWNISNPTGRDLDQRFYLQYLIYMFKFLHLHHMEMQTFEKTQQNLADCPAPIINRFLRDFAEQKPGAKNKFSRPQIMKDKLINYILVLILNLENFRFSCADVIASDMKVSLSRFLTYCRELGCVVDSSRRKRVVGEDEGESTTPTEKLSPNSYSVFLKAPLTFPKLKMGAPSKK